MEEYARWPNGWCNGPLLGIIELCSYSHSANSNQSQGLILRRKLIGATTWESRLKAKNCNRGQLFRTCWVSSARCSKQWSNQLVDWYPYTAKCRWWWPQMKLKSKSLPTGQYHMQNAWQGTTGNGAIVPLLSQMYLWALVMEGGV